MKKFLRLSYVFILLMPAFSSRAQVYINGQNINQDSSIQYIEVIHFIYYPLNFSIESVDIGTINPSRAKFTDANGKKLHFSTSVDLLTYMKKNGWTILRRDIEFQSRKESAYNAQGFAFILFERSY